MFDFRLYVITDRNACAPRSLQSVVREACDAGVRAVQLREKDLTPREVEQYTSRLLEITRVRSTKLLVNRRHAVDDPEEAFLAASLETDGFHFPDGVPFPHELKTRFPELLIGVSTHSARSAVAAETEGASFVTFGPVFETPSKSGFGPPQGLDVLAAVASSVNIPVFAVGGVTPDNTVRCLEAGAHGVAVVGAIMRAGDVTAAVRKFEDVLGSL